MTDLRAIDGKAKTVRELLKGVKYSIDYFQREYKWQDKQIRELIEDLSGKFLEEYDPTHERRRVAEYPHYLLGSIIISKKGGENSIVDGQQRMTSLTLFLIFLRNLQQGRATQVSIDDLIFSESYGIKSFNMDVPDRLPAMEALYKGQPIDVTGRSDSVQNVVARYRDIETCFPQELRDDALPYFIDWLLNNVHLVEIVAYNDDDAYTIFETMNDRGLSLSPTDMLKGYLLANMAEDRRTAVNTRWRERLRALNDAGKEVEADCFKAWLRSQYSTKIRERKKDARAEDFDRIGTEFHRWLRDTAPALGLDSSDDFYRFVDRDFDFYSRHYLRIVEASNDFVPGLAGVFYNAQLGFTLQNMLLLAPLRPEDSAVVVDTKLRVVATFLDILLARRIWNFRQISYSTMQYAMFNVMKSIRGLTPQELAATLTASLADESETFDSNGRLRVHQQNRYLLHRILARLSDYVETESGNPSRYVEFVTEGPNRYEVEHVWADHASRHTDEFASPADFTEYRNRLGGLLLLPKKFNASYNDLPYAEKVPHYLSQNLLARSLHPGCYDHNPGFMQFVARSGLPFRPHEQFKKADLDDRQELYRQIAKRIWDPARVQAEVTR
jgi:hypothetical protein